METSSRATSTGIVLENAHGLKWVQGDPCIQCGFPLYIINEKEFATRLWVECPQCGCDNCNHGE